jgi:uncharacterized membrane protein
MQTSTTKDMDHDTFFNGEEEDTGSEQQKAPAVNVGDLERIASGFAGGMMTICALKRGGISGLLLGLIGGSLVYRGATGHCSLYSALDINTAKKAERAGDVESHSEEIHADEPGSKRKINMKAASAKAQQWVEAAGVE